MNYQEIMENPLNAFKDSMIYFEIYRNSQLISTTKGLKNSYQGKVYVEFFPDVDVQIGDILTNSNIKYYIIDVDTQTWQGQISAVKAFYQTKPPTNQQVTPTIYNIGSATNSIIGNQQQAILNNSSFSIDDLKQFIELYGENDKQQLYELASLLQESLQKDDFHKSKLSKFGDLIAKHSWLPTAIAQIISAFIQMPH